MIYTASEYCKKFLFGNKHVSPMTIRRRCNKEQLPSGHKAIKLPGDTGTWIIEVEEDTPSKSKFEIV
jgi:hypothetical protein